MAQTCIGFVCFEPLATDGPKFFGFSEFLAALALMVLAWTIADFRYRFRVLTAPLPLRRISFGVVATVGALTLLTDLWRAEGWLVPVGGILTPASWQAVLGGTFFLTFLTWAWFGLIRPARFGRSNARRYASTLYAAIVKSDKKELAVVADELTYSLPSIIRFATDQRSTAPGSSLGDIKRSLATECADDILLLMGDRRFCRVVVETCPAAAGVLFEAVRDTDKYGVMIGAFARNITNEAIMNKNSFLYHEVEGYYSGLVGYLKPVTHALYGTHELVEVVGTGLDPDLDTYWNWDHQHWRAYCRAALTAFSDYVENGAVQHSYTLYRAQDSIAHAARDIYKINATASSWEHDSCKKLEVAVDFAADAVAILNKKQMQGPSRLPKHPGRGTIHDYVADLISELILNASQVQSPRDLAWSIQHNTVWRKFFNFEHARNPGIAEKGIQRMVLALLWRDIKEMGSGPNYKGARILSFCLNILGISLRSDDYFRDTKGLHKAVLRWTKKNFARIHALSPDVAAACLVEGFSYEPEQHRLARRDPHPLRAEVSYTYLIVDPLPEPPPEFLRQ